MEKSINIIDEFGKEKELEIIDSFTIENRNYVIVSSKDSEEAYAYKETKKQGNEIEYTSIGPGAEFNKILKEYNSRNK